MLHVCVQKFDKLKDTSRADQLVCVISYFFKLYLMLHVCVQKFDVTENLEIFWELNRGYFSVC